MKYISTRGEAEKISGSLAVISSMAKDGGLYAPIFIPKIELSEFSDLDYKNIAKKILKIYFDEFDEGKAKDIVSNYDLRFKEKIADVKTFADISFLELFHGETAAFKDMALSVLPSIMKNSYEINERNEKILILTATSGDTGSAVLNGFSNQKGIDIAVFYPDGGVSEIQKIQMESVVSENANVFPIVGNFDDAQRAIKEIFTNQEIKKIAEENNKIIASANSINIGRLIPQIAYYFYAYFKLSKNAIKLGEKIDISVPTGNFGDILAGIYAKHMGLPIENVICASNSNNVLTEFLNSGKYNANRKFNKTYSPSMDILISSNLERFLYLISEGDTKLISKAYENLKNCGEFIWEGEIPSYIKGEFATDKETLDSIKEVFENYDYLIDPHTAAAYKASKISKRHCLILSTASPYKFSDAVIYALTGEKFQGKLVEKIEKLENISATKIPNSIKQKLNLEIKDKKPVSKLKIKDEVIKLLEK